MYTINRNRLFSYSLLAALAVTGLASQGALADASDDGYRYVDGKVGWIYAPDTPETAQSKALKANRAAPDSVSGFRYVGRRIGWIYAPGTPESQQSKVLKAGRAGSGSGTALGEVGDAVDATPDPGES